METVVRKLSCLALQNFYQRTRGEEYVEQIKNPDYQDLSFEDRFGILVDLEWTRRQNSKLERLIKSAELRDTQASIEDIEYHSDRKLDKSQILRLASGQYIEDHHNIILKGASGNGKTYLACAFGIAACRFSFFGSFVSFDSDSLSCPVFNIVCILLSVGLGV